MRGLSPLLLSSIIALGFSACGGATPEPLPVEAEPPADAGAPAEEAVPVDAGPAPEKAEVPAPTPAPTPAPPVELGVDFPLEKKRRDDRPRPPPDEVVADGKMIAEQFDELPELEEPPPFLKAQTLLRALPGYARRELREDIEDALGPEGGGGLDLQGGYLDEAESRYLLRYHHGATENVYLLLDGKGRTLGRLRFEERTGVLLRDVVGDGTKEVIVTVIEGMGLSSYPEAWHLYEASRGGLRRIGRVAKEYSQGSRNLDYYFVNSVTFPERDVMRVETVLHGGHFEDLEPPRGSPRGVGELAEYRYKRGGAFRRTRHVPGKVEYGSDDVRVFEVAIHVATAYPDRARKAIDAKLEDANERYDEVAVQFDPVSWNELPGSFSVLETIRERHQLKKYFVERAINVFVLDEILDPNPSAATKKAARWQGREPSGRLSGAHIVWEGHRPDTYIILARRSPAISLAHELGHFFGLPHVKDPRNIMSYSAERVGFDNRQLEVIRRNALKVARRKMVRLVE